MDVLKLCNFPKPFTWEMSTWHSLAPKVIIRRKAGEKWKGNNLGELKKALTVRFKYSAYEMRRRETGAKWMVWRLQNVWKHPAN